MQTHRLKLSDRVKIIQKRHLSFSCLFLCLFVYFCLSLYPTWIVNYPYSSFTSNTGLLPPFMAFCLSSLYFMLFSGTPSASITSSLHMSYPDFPISALPWPVSVHTMLLSSLLLPISVFFWHDYHVCSPFLSFPFSVFFLSCAMFWPATADSLSLHGRLLSSIVCIFCISILCVLLEISTQSLLLYSLIQFLTVSGNYLCNCYYKYYRRTS